MIDRERVENTWTLPAGAGLMQLVRVMKSIRKLEKGLIYKIGKNDEGRWVVYYITFEAVPTNLLYPLGS